MLFAVDQGATITVNGGQTWSSWYNQPTAEFYHVITDNQYPYWVYGGQQESGSAGVSSRGDRRDHRPRLVNGGAEEYGYIAPDPLDPNIIYGGKLTRFDKRTGQVRTLCPRPSAGKYRFLRTGARDLFACRPAHALFAGNVLFKTTNGGRAGRSLAPTFLVKMGCAR